MKRKAAVLVTLALLCVSCATLSQKHEEAYKTLAVMAESYDTAMKIVASAYNRGLLSNEEREQITNAARVFWSAFHQARIAVEIWYATKDVNDGDRAIAVMNEAVKRYTELMVYVEPLLRRVQQ